MTGWSGQDWAMAMGGVTVLITGVVSAITNLVTLRRVGNVAEVTRDVAKKVDGMLVQRDASNVAAGVTIGRQAGDDASAQRDEGARQERELHRESSALAPTPNGVPVPVADDRTAAGVERTAAANERIADAAETAAKKPYQG